MSRRLIVFALGFVLVAAALVGVWLLPGSASPPPDGAGAASLPAPQASALGRPDACPAQPVVKAAVAGGKDGQLPLQSDVSGLIAADVGSFLLTGKESAAAGRQRDAEVAFLMACRVANQLKGTDSVQLADAQYQLGSLYARLGLDASTGSVASNRSQLLERAQALYSDSLKAYLAKYGKAHEKSKFAAQGLAAVRQPQSQPDVQAKARTKEGRAVPQPAPTSAPPAGFELPAPRQEAAAWPLDNTGPGQGPAPVAGISRSSREALGRPELARAAPQADGARAGPSFNCAKARSANEKMICDDAELSLLDRELGQVYAHAKAVTANRATFRRQQAHEWQLRESLCRDRACLLRWYAQRNEQLQGDISDAQDARAPARVSR